MEVHSEWLRAFSTSLRGVRSTCWVTGKGLRNASQSNHYRTTRNHANRRIQTHFLVARKKGGCWKFYRLERFYFAAVQPYGGPYSQQKESHGITNHEDINSFQLFNAGSWPGRHHLLEYMTSHSLCKMAVMAHSSPTPQNPEHSAPEVLMISIA